MQGYILTYPMIRQKEALMALGSHQGFLNFCVHGAPVQGFQLGTAEDGEDEIHEAPLLRPATSFNMQSPATFTAYTVPFVY